MINPLTLIPPQYKLVGELIGVLVVLGLAGYAGYHYRDLSAKAEVLQIQTQLQQSIIKQQEVVANYESELTTIVTKTGEDTYANDQKHNQELAYYKQLVAQSGGLYDHNTANSTGNSTSASSTTSTTAATSGERLSEAATQFLLEQANSADKVVSQYLTCQQYVQSITTATQQGEKHE